MQVNIFFPVTVLKQLWKGLGLHSYNRVGFPQGGFASNTHFCDCYNSAIIFTKVS